MYTLPYLLLSRIHQAAINARRCDRTWHYLAWSAVAGVMASSMFALATSFIYLLFQIGLWPLAIAMIGVLLVPLFATLLARTVLVPLGVYRIAYYAGLLGRPGKDPAAYGLCVAAWAVARDPSGAGEAWVTAKRDARIPLGDGEVVVTALIAAARGDAETARVMLRSILMLVEHHPAVRELAGEWLACDAAERGAWIELADDAACARWPATPLTYFLEGVAANRIGAPNAPGPREMWARWLLAPHRKHTRVLRDGRDAPASAPAPVDAELVTADAASPPAPAPLPRAIAAHLAFGHDDPTSLALGATVHAWDAALSDGATHSWLARRALELDAPPGAIDRALREVAAAVTEDLARIADRAQLAAPPSNGPIGDALGRRLRHGRLDALEHGLTRWAERRHDGDLRAPIDEWREFIALHTAYSAAVIAGGIELRRLAFPHAFTTGSSMAAWMWNTRQEYALSHAISKWLLAEALLVGDTEAIELGHRNCALNVPTRVARDALH